MHEFLSIEAAISTINWDFQGALSNYGLHRFHWYPGTFIPQIPAYLIELFTRPGDVIYDPFCGVGTSIVEALRLGRHAIGVDVNFIASKVARSKTTLFHPPTIKELSNNFIENLQTERQKIGLLSGASLPLYQPSHELQELEEDYHDIAVWYDERTFQELLIIWMMIGREEGSFRNLLQVAFSKLLKKCSSQLNHWGYVADNMVPDQNKKYYTDAIKLFVNTLREFVDALIQFLESPMICNSNVAELNRRACILQSDLTQGSPVKANSIDLIITSPPYVNVTDYTRSQRLSLYWFKKDVNLLKLNEVGARWKRARKGSVEKYFQEMTFCVRHISEALKPGKFLCMVVGESKDHKEKYQTIDRLKAMILQEGFAIPFDPIVRLPSQQRLKARTGNTNQEYILMFQKL